MTDPKRPCAVCGAPSPKRLGLPGVTVHACPGCGHEFSAVDRVQGDIYDAAYFAVDHANWFDNPDTGLFAIIETILAERLGRDAAVIDLGCGPGNLLRHLAARGFTDLSGLDIIDQELPGLTYLKTPIEVFAPTRRYDAAVSVANIEHIADARGYMAATRRIVRPGGLAIIYTVDNKSLLYRLAKGLAALGPTFAARRLYETHHVNHYSVASLGRLARDHGFTPLSLVRRNIPARSVDLPPGAPPLLMKTAIAAIHLAASATGGEMLQLAAFVRDGGD